MARPCDRNITIEFHQDVGQIIMADAVCFEGLIHYASFVLIKEEEDDL